jgi:uncharacterized membrane protein
METSQTSITHKQEPQSSTTDAQQWASLIGGGALVLYGLSRRSLKGALLALAGGGLVYRTVAEQENAPDMEQSIKVEKTLTINKSPQELY